VVKATTSGRLSVRVALVTAIAVAGGCGWDGPMSTLVAHSDLNRSILRLYTIITWATVAIGLVVFAGLAWILLRYRSRPAGALPAQTRGHTLLELAWTIAPALVLLVIAIPSIQVTFRTQSAATQAGALQVIVRGYQWWWEFHYPSLEVLTANEVHIPAGRPVEFVLEGPDVIHSFWVPQLGGKRDVVPGRVNRITLTAERAGEYWGQCAEFCGLSHANMALRVIVDTPETFARWVAAQRAPAVEPAGDAARGKEIYAKSACVGCHTIAGVSTGVLGPTLTHFGSRGTLAAGMWPNTPDNVATWVRDPQGLKPGVKMPNLGLTAAQAKDVAAYLSALK
jgi:cytochrome c oxidase subunit II